ncbi:MAG TPA: acyl carrier protein [Anaerolineales bacterium]|nr:acyl carrier protein [Anaerolineales bacterium]HMV96762.1 acyl carrier protein [Anaerolineales bacterium]HMX20231.1 acyl carrier protein [Anaerolineales bacterium]HMX76476.1 acyl carrier protein [Anaerolineales bacterium]HMZ41740.1 acyl carrier protein [Anaerolineales bacterium]
MEEIEIKEKLKKFICTEIMNDADYPLKFDEPLITSGLIDSFSLAQVGVFVEIEFQIYIPDPELTVDNMNTIDAMAARIKEKMG